MNDLYQSAVARDDFQRWLDLGHAPFTVWQGDQPLVTLFRLEKRSEMDYLYRISPNKDTGISWDNSPLFCGVYDMKNRALYLAKDALGIFMEGRFPLIGDTRPSVTREICGRVNQRVESIVNNDRNNLPARELTGWPAQRELQEYREFGAKEDALRRFFDNAAPDGQFHGGYTMGNLPETAFIAYIQDPEGFIQTESARAAERDRVKLLYGIPYVEDSIYLDTPENRRLLDCYSRGMQRVMLNKRNTHKGHER